MAKDWVWRTTILLQEALRDFVVARVRAGTLSSLTEAELRRAAFDSHPRAYTEGGLSRVAMVAPELIPIIATIPTREFMPWSSSFGPSVRQVLSTLGLVLPQVPGYALGALAGPAHTGLFRIAADRDQRRFMDEMRLATELSRLRSLLKQGQVDDLATLDELARRLQMQGFQDQGFATQAPGLLQAIEARRQHLRQYYRNLLQRSPEVRERVRSRFPRLFTP